MLGPSGTGKSTLLLAMLGLLPQRGGWAHGEVLVNGRNILAMSRSEARDLRGRTFALVPQSPLAALNPALTLERHFTEAWRAHRPPDKAGFEGQLFPLLERVRLPRDRTFLRRRPGQISVGQAQRCTLALALLHGPSVLIADEPTSSLDPVTQADVISLLRETTLEKGTALLFVSHDLLSVLRLCSKVAALAHGGIVEHLAVGEIARAQSPALQDLLRALPVAAEVLLRHMGAGNERGTEVLEIEALLTQRL